RLVRAGVGVHAIAAVPGGANGEHARVFAHVGPGAAPVALQVSDQLADAHVAIRRGPPVHLSRQSALPARGEQVQRIPATGPPALGDSALLEQDVVDTGLPCAPARGQTRLTAANHDHVRGRHALSSRESGRVPGSAPPGASTSTLTATPLRNTSSTAERASDCCTTARSTSAGAWPSMR